MLSGLRATIRTVSATSSLRPPAASLTTRIATGGWKSQIWDGGLHVAGFVHSPLLPKSAQGTQHHGLFHVTDWLPTIVAAAGGDTSINQPLDGGDAGAFSIHLSRLPSG